MDTDLKLQLQRSTLQLASQAVQTAAGRSCCCCRCCHFLKRRAHAAAVPVAESHVLLLCGRTPVCRRAVSCGGRMPPCGLISTV